MPWVQYLVIVSVSSNYELLLPSPPSAAPISQLYDHILLFFHPTLIKTHLCPQDRAQPTVLHVALLHTIERKTASHVGVQDKELLGVTAQDFVAEMVQATSGTESLVFAEVTEDVGRENGTRGVGRMS